MLMAKGISMGAVSTVSHPIFLYLYTGIFSTLLAQVPRIYIFHSILLTCIPCTQVLSYNGGGGPASGLVALCTYAGMYLASVFSGDEVKVMSVPNSPVDKEKQVGEVMAGTPRSITNHHYKLNILQIGFEIAGESYITRHMHPLPLDNVMHPSRLTVQHRRAQDVRKRIVPRYVHVKCLHMSTCIL